MNSLLANTMALWFSDSTKNHRFGTDATQFEESLSPRDGPSFWSTELVFFEWQLQRFNGPMTDMCRKGVPFVTREKGCCQCRVLAAIHWVLPLIPSWFGFVKMKDNLLKRPFDLANWETPIHVTTFEIFTCFAYLCFAMSRMWRFASLRRLSFAVGISLVACDACEPIAADGETERDFMHLLQRFSHRTARCGLSLLMFITHRGTELLRYWMILIHCRAF